MTPKRLDQISYQQLRDPQRTSADVRSVLQAENTAAEEFLTTFSPWRDRVTKALHERENYTQYSPEQAYNGRWLRTVHPASAEYPRYETRTGDGPWVTYFDITHLVAGSDTGIHVGSVTCSDDFDYVAVTVDTVGDENYDTVIFRTIDTIAGRYEPISRITNTCEDVVFSAHADGIWVLRRDSTTRSAYLDYHRNFDTNNAIRVLHETDPALWLTATASASGTHLIVAAQGHNGDGIYLYPRDNVTTTPDAQLPMTCGRYVDIDTADGHTWWALLTGKGQRENYVHTGTTHQGLDTWQAVRVTDERYPLVSIDVRTEHLVINARKDGYPAAGVLTPATSAFTWLPGAVGTLGSVAEGALDPRDRRVVVTSSSYTQPDITHTYQLDDPTNALASTRVRIPGYDAHRYRSVAQHVRASDHQNIPVTVNYRADTPVRGIVLYGYGAYGTSDDPDFTPGWSTLHDEGIITMVAHVRGGGEHGTRWHHAGRGAHKQRSIDDYCDVARHLQRTYAGTPIIALGASAGGLLVGAALNTAPELFAGVVADVPFVDCLATMSDATAPLTTSEYTEWGDPRTADGLANLTGLCVVTNTHPGIGNTPVLAIGGYQDPRVAYWEPARWVKKLRDVGAGDHAYLLTDFHSGHSGSSGRYDHITKQATMYTFIHACVEAFHRQRSEYSIAVSAVRTTHA